MDGTLRDRIMTALSTVMDPELNTDIGSLGMIGTVEAEGSHADVTVVLVTDASPHREELESRIRTALADVPGLDTVGISFASRVAMAGAEPLPGIRHVIS